MPGVPGRRVFPDPNPPGSDADETIHLPDVPPNTQRLRGIAAQLSGLAEEPPIAGIPMRPDDIALLLCALQLAFQVAAGVVSGDFVSLTHPKISGSALWAMDG